MTAPTDDKPPANGLTRYPAMLLHDIGQPVVIPHELVYLAADVDALLAGERATHAAALAARDAEIARRLADNDELRADAVSAIAECNGEIGRLQPLAEIGRLAVEERKAWRAYMNSDVIHGDSVRRKAYEDAGNARELATTAYIAAQSDGGEVMSDESKDWRMDAYYYGFYRTGQDAIDRVLSAVACAGKSFHHTEMWTEDNSPYPHLRGESCVDWIQNAATDAAAEFAELRTEVERLRVASEPIPFECWHEDIGEVLWWAFPVTEPPYVGSPLDTDWPGYHTHFTILPPLPVDPALSEAVKGLGETGTEEATESGP